MGPRTDRPFQITEALETVQWVEEVRSQRTGHFTTVMEDGTYGVSTPKTSSTEDPDLV